ncbi:MAG: M20/M25/M40 family metallo-hydrolase [Planctomycetes bacterium]|nr:M20/M25/M40 family metallo-hydrolase [Planctomycetota bacterium]
MEEDSRKFLERLLATAAPSGFESSLQQLWLERTTPFADITRKDVHGNAAAVLNPGEEFKVMLAGHCDEIGLMVMNINEQGMLEVGGVGGFDPAVAPGLSVEVMTRNGKVNGVIGKRAPHGKDDEDEKKKAEIADLWVDIGAADREEAEKTVSIGDPIVSCKGPQNLLGDRMASPAVDDRVGVFICSETLRLLREREISAGVWVVSTVQEEIGSRGARTSCFGIAPQVAIALDVTHASDYPTSEKKYVGDVKLGSGPVLCRGANVNPKVDELLREAARRAEVQVQIRPVPKVTMTDANPIQMSRAGVATGMIGIPVRYMHSPVETFSLSDVENAARLLAEFIFSLDADEDFVP